MMPVPWYTLHPRHIRLRVILPPILLFLLLCSFDEKHLWQWSWSSGPHARYNCQPVTDSAGRQRQAWRWVQGQEIRLYYQPGTSYRPTMCSAAAIKKLVDDLGLDLTVRVLAAPARVRDAVARSTILTDGEPMIVYDRLCRELVASRTEAAAEMVFVPCAIDRATDVVGESKFMYGVAVLDARRATMLTALHETGHLLGYHLHDTWPVTVVGYGNPHWTRYARTAGANLPLMIPYDDGDYLSERSRDALICFWRGLERRTGQRLFLPEHVRLYARK